ncbi:MAG: hypothetical protein US25_C0083G0002 [Candidatus Moranbacteria bacterium GW2011_GWE1_36_7]|nr:MAG: hypothetical protein UR99_C0066G0002 [Candidatus Moranbacteria bacterium GW2011_GWD2_36_12]KKQ04536.1 MAG: hypothetical protein US16_C0055G0002 [Candidatus Moranbacteria bacterium GW2011_GWE2_36_40]KKQ11475.1 MAG: hypothetical protein US25_C0083G0002 [Candidatus Moranbacteria bacterium GW2011_GWE1_36_7]
MEQITSQSDYGEKASSFSKLIMAVFFISYVYMVFTAGGDAGGWLWPMLFLAVGLFISSIFIAAPLYVLIRLFPRFSMVITILSIVLTFFVTRVMFIWLIS